VRCGTDNNACPSSLSCNVASGLCETPGGGAVGVGGIDASGPATDASPTIDAPSAFCSVAGIVACYEFEGNARDSSGNALDATATGVGFAPGEVGLAMQVGTSSATTVGASLLFNHVAAVTIEAWIKLSQLPGTSQQSVILDVNNEYAFAINDDGTVTCDLRGLGTFTTAAKVMPDHWTHVACTYDGATAGLIYVNGGLAASHPGSGQLATGNNPMSIAANYPTGSQLVGLIDQLRLLSVARSGADICGDAGETVCISPP
jgi:hypothetical protein